MGQTHTHTHTHIYIYIYIYTWDQYVLVASVGVDAYSLRPCPIRPAHMCI